MGWPLIVGRRKRWPKKRPRWLATSVNQANEKIIDTEKLQLKFFPF
jgi:hypothetical protein